MEWRRDAQNWILKNTNDDKNIQNLFRKDSRGAVESRKAIDLEVILSKIERSNSLANIEVNSSVIFCGSYSFSTINTGRSDF